MSENSKIEWCDHTFNPWIGCTKVSPGCDHCYAKADFEDRKHRVIWGAGQERSRTKTWGDPVKWNKAHAEFFAQHGRRQRVFCASLADVFDNEVPSEWRRDLFDLIDSTPNLDWLLLTKRIGNVRSLMPRMIGGHADGGPYFSNVWLGATIVNQAEADRDIPKLLATPARVRFLSMEPLLGPVELDPWLKVCKHWKSADSLPNAPWHPPYPKHWYEPQALVLADWKCPIDWVIVGGESGPHARPMHPDWARSIRDQCAAARVPFMFKQWGEWAPDEHFTTLRHELHEWGDGVEITARSWRQGKKVAGRLLDGVEHNGYPSL